MKEHDIRPPGLFAEFHRRNAEDVKRFFSDRAILRQQECPACGTEDSHKLFEANSFPVVKCVDCGSTYVTPRPSADSLEDFYRHSESQKYLAEVWYPTTRDARIKHIFLPRAQLIANTLAELGIGANTIIDVGAGAGMMLSAYQEAGLQGTFRAVEPHESLANECRNRGFDVFAGFSGEAAEASDWQNSGAVVSAFEVFEHVSSPLQFVQELASLTRPGGVVIFTAVNGNGFDIVTLGKHANAVCPPHHLNYLSVEGVRRLLKRCGLAELSITTPGALDVDIVGNRKKEFPSIELGTFIDHLYEEQDDEVRSAFQRFLGENLLSSHMMVVARK